MLHTVWSLPRARLAIRHPASAWLEIPLFFRATLGSTVQATVVCEGATLPPIVITVQYRGGRYWLHDSSGGSTVMIPQRHYHYLGFTCRLMTVPRSWRLIPWLIPSCLWVMLSCRAMMVAKTVSEITPPVGPPAVSTNTPLTAPTAKIVQQQRLIIHLMHTFEHGNTENYEE